MVPPPPGGTAAPKRGAGERPPPPPQPLAPTGTAGNNRIRANAPGCRTDRLQRRQALTNRSGMGPTPSMTRTTPVPPALLPAQGRQRDGTTQSDPPPHWPPHPHRRGAWRTGRPPPPHHPPAQERHGCADPPQGGRTTPSQVGGNRDRAAPPPSTPDGARDRERTRGGAQTAWNGPTSAQSQDRARYARHTTQRGVGSGRRGSASAHTHKGHAGTTRRSTGPSSRNAQTAWNGVPASEG